MLHLNLNTTLAATQLLVLSPAACATDNGDDADASDETTASSDTADDPEPEPEPEPEPVDDTDSEGPAAGCECADGAPCAEPLCDVVAWVDEDYDGELDADAVAAFEASSACALAALRDGAPGHLSWTLDQNGGQFSEHGSHSLFGDATVRISHGGTVDLCTYEDDAVVLAPLASSQQFADCLALPAEQRFHCIRAPGGMGQWTTCVEETLHCDGV